MGEHLRERERAGRGTGHRSSGGGNRAVVDPGKSFRQRRRQQTRQQILQVERLPNRLATIVHAEQSGQQRWIRFVEESGKIWGVETGLGSELFIAALSSFMSGSAGSAASPCSAIDKMTRSSMISACTSALFLTYTPTTSSSAAELPLGGHQGVGGLLFRCKTDFGDQLIVARRGGVKQGRLQHPSLEDRPDRRLSLPAAILPGPAQGLVQNLPGPGYIEHIGRMSRPSGNFLLLPPFKWLA